jgi:PAS domain S-box-containing protein
MLHLSQLSDSEDVKRIYCESINDYLPGLGLSISDENNEREKAVYPLKKKDRIFGYVVLQKALTSFDNETQLLIRNSFGLLCVILENKYYSKVLEDRASELQKSLLANEKLLDHITQTVPEIIYIHDVDNKKNIFVNRAYEERFGFTKNEIHSMGASFLKNVVHHEDIESLVQHQNALREMKQGSVSSLEYRMKDKEGKWHWLLSRDTPYNQDESNSAFHILGCATDITELKNTQNSLQTSLNENTVLLREVHHRVKNNLAIISSFLSLQTMHTENNDVIQMLSESRNRIQSMALVHEELYNSESLSDIKIEKYLQNIIKHILSSFGLKDLNLKVDYDISVKHLNMDSSIPMGLILNELITNSVKYAFANLKEGYIHIKLYKDKQDTILKYSDNGVGLPEGFDVNTPDTLGFKIVSALVVQLKGTMSYESKNGLAFTIVFNKNMED